MRLRGARRRMSAGRPGGDGAAVATMAKAAASAARPPPGAASDPPAGRPPEEGSSRRPSGRRALGGGPGGRGAARRGCARSARAAATDDCAPAPLPAARQAHLAERPLTHQVDDMVVLHGTAGGPGAPRGRENRRVRSCRSGHPPQACAAREDSRDRVERLHRSYKRHAAPGKGRLAPAGRGVYQRLLPAHAFLLQKRMRALWASGGCGLE